MRPPSARIFNETLTIRRKGWGVDGAGGGLGADQTTTTIRASVQPLSANRTPEHLRASGITAYDILTATDPALDAEDHLVRSSGEILVVDAPAMDQAGRSAMWVTVAKRLD